MTKKELMAYITNGESTDEIPCGFWKHFPKEAATGKASVEAHLNYYNETGVPIMKVMNEHIFPLNTKISCANDWENVRETDIHATDYENYLAEIRAFRKAAGEDAFILATIHGLLVSACHATDGMGKFTDRNNTVTTHFKEKPEKVAAGLGKMADTIKRLCKACVAAGADGIYYAALGAEEGRFPDGLYETYVKPLEMDILADAAQNGVVFLHVCKENPQLEIFRDYPCHVVNWAEYAGRYTLEEGSLIFPGKCILGGFDNTKGIFFTGTDEELQKQIEDVLRRMGRRRLIFGADCTIAESTDNRRIKKIVDLIKSERRAEQK